MGAPGWTKEEEDKLRQLHADGWTYGRMVSQLPGKTRSGIVGKAMRMGLSSDAPRPRSKYAAGRQAAPVATNPQPAPTPQPVPPPAPVAAYNSTSVTLMQLKDGMCRWPVQDEPHYMFCGQGKSSLSSYCPHHRALAYKREPKQEWIEAKSGLRLRNAVSRY
jgi:GcrA cell cycle regulator